MKALTTFKAVSMLQDHEIKLIADYCNSIEARQPIELQNSEEQYIILSLISAYTKEAQKLPSTTYLTINLKENQFISNNVLNNIPYLQEVEENFVLTLLLATTNNMLSTLLFVEKELKNYKEISSILKRSNSKCYAILAIRPNVETIHKTTNSEEIAQSIAQTLTRLDAVQSVTPTNSDDLIAMRNEIENADDVITFYQKVQDQTFSPKLSPNLFALTLQSETTLDTIAIDSSIMGQFNKSVLSQLKHININKTKGILFLSPALNNQSDTTLDCVEEFLKNKYPRITITKTTDNDTAELHAM